jgi:hypothetical protein
MFDYFKIDYPLPLESYILAEYRPYVYAVVNQDEFQSKDLDCCLNRYYVDNNGYIFIDESNFEDSKPAMRPIYYHGHIKIYTLVPLDQDDVTSKRKFWLEYDLKFTDSRVVSAIMISPTREDLKGILGSEGSSI